HKMVLIQGSVLRDADRFQVDLTCGSSMEPRADVAFHFNPRFRTPCVVCNALQGGRWGREEVLDLNPFRAGDPFELIVLVLKDTFKVALNGAHLVDFQQRVDLQRVDTLCISGGVLIQAAGILPSFVSLMGRCFCLLPFRGELAGGLSVGRSISITGETQQHAHRYLSVCGPVCLWICLWTCLWTSARWGRCMGWPESGSLCSYTDLCSLNKDKHIQHTAPEHNTQRCVQGRGSTTTSLLCG
uniref:Galectin n=1 Tax=Cyclopterus lumpus TaxID=8103 RepID=A0A8C2XL36_CYCLU